jgi:hypothetical protein
MKKKELFVGMLALALVFGLLLTGCKTDSDEEEADTWSAVTTIAQLNGTWSGSFSTPPQTVQEFLGGAWDGFSDVQKALLTGINVTTSMEVAMTINATDNTQATSAKVTMTFSGTNIATAWEGIRAFIGGMGTVDNANHSVSMTNSSAAAQITDADKKELLESDVQINQKGTKLKVPADPEDGTPEVIMYKQ